MVQLDVDGSHGLTCCGQGAFLCDKDAFLCMVNLRIGLKPILRITKVYCKEKHIYLGDGSFGKNSLMKRQKD